MPRAKWMSDYDYEKFERCLKDFSGDGNKYAICTASIKKGKQKRKRVQKRLK